MMRINMLDVEFAISSSEPGLLDYIDAFMCAYEDRPPAMKPTIVINIAVQHGSLPEGLLHGKVQVHRSKHSYWNFDGYLFPQEGRQVLWPSKGVFIQLDANATTVNVVVENNVDRMRAGEAIFHLCRSLALYQRSGSQGTLVHASAVAVGQSAVLFCGEAGAGKTTLMTEAVLRGYAKPLANDRVLITSDPYPSVVSWPSYASFCEGTLLKHPALAQAVVEYEHNRWGYQTQTWPQPLLNTFTKDAKRVYPMMWFSQATGTHYVSRRRLRVLTFVRVSPDVCLAEVNGLSLKEMEGRQSVATLLGKFTFDDSEPSFLPWHGLPLPQGAPSLQDLIQRLEQAEIRVCTLRVSPDNLTPLFEILKEAHDAK